LLLAWYVLVAAVAGVAPVDREAWTLASIPPTAFVVLLAATRRRFPLSNASYLLLGAFLTLHTVGVHYTYAQVPLGDWVRLELALGRNHFDRLVHFAFGLLLTYPLLEGFGRLVAVRRLVVYYLAVMTSVGLSALWEILEAWVAQAVSPEAGVAFLGAQGDIWDAQNDMAAALYGAVLCALLTAALSRPSVDSAAGLLADEQNG
jgi:putative membrane protein